MTMHDGVPWIAKQFAEAKRIATQGAKRAKAPYKMTTEEEITLVFSRYGTERTMHVGTGRVAGSRSVELEEKESLPIPVGTEVLLYCLPDDTEREHNKSVATFFVGGKQVTYKNGVDLFHRKPATPKPRSVPAAAPLMGLT